MIDFGANRLSQRRRIGLSKHAKGAWRRHDDEAMGFPRLHQSVKSRQKPMKKGRLFLIVKIGRLDRTVYACRHLSNATRPVGAKIPRRLFLMFVNLARCEFGEHLVAFILEQNSLVAVADNDPIAMTYFHVLAGKRKSERPPMADERSPMED
jgi:hypothetical protein